MFFVVVGFGDFFCWFGFVLVLGIFLFGFFFGFGGFFCLVGFWFGFLFFFLVQTESTSSADHF